MTRYWSRVWRGRRWHIVTRTDAGTLPICRAPHLRYWQTYTAITGAHATCPPDNRGVCHGCLDHLLLAGDPLALHLEHV